MIMGAGTSGAGMAYSGLRNVLSAQNSRGTSGADSLLPPLPQNEAQTEPVRVGRNTTIQRPYQGKTPAARTNANYPHVAVPDSALNQARAQIEVAQKQTETGKGFKKSLKDFYRQALSGLFNGRTVTVENASFEGLPYDVTLNNQVISKVVSDPNMSAEKLAVLNSVEEVVKNAEYVGSGAYQPHGTKTKNVTRYDYFETQADIGGQEYTVSFDVEVIPGVNKYRTHKVIKNIELNPANGVEARSRTGRAAAESTLYTHSIPQAAQKTSQDAVFLPPLPQNETQTPGVFHQAAQQRALEEAKVTEEELSAIDRMASDKGLNVEYVYDTTSGVDGFIRGNTITVNLASDSASFGTAVHEIGHSMRKANEAQYVKFQNAVLRMAEQDAALSDYANKVRSMYTAQNSPALKSLLNEDGTVNSAALDEEVSLKLAEQIVSDPQKLTEAVSGDRGLMATFLDFVRGIKNSIAIKLTNSQKAMLDEAERTLVNLLRGEAGSVDGTRYSIEKDGKERYDNFKPFGGQVDDAVNGRMPRANDLLMGETPQVLQKVGLNALPMTMTARHAQTICNSNGQDQNANYHGLGELLKQLPEAMKDPVAVIRSETRRGNSVVVLADLKDQSGNSVVVPVRVDGYGRLNGVEIDANAAASAYGKKNAVAGLLKNALAAEAQGEVGVYYINKNKAKSPSLAAGVQFPGGVHGLDGFIHSIHEQKADVNTSLPDVTGSKQFKRWFGDWQKSPMSASKIVDAEGKPLVMYHGTRAENGDFAVFDADKAVKKRGRKSLTCCGKWAILKTKSRK